MEVYYIRLSYDPKLVEFVKKIFWLIFLPVVAYLYNYYNLKFDIFFCSIYNIILYVILYSYFFNWNEDDFGNIKEKIAFALIVESVMISYQKFYYTTTSWYFWTKEVEVTIAPNMFSLVTSMSYSLSLIIRNKIKVSDRPKNLLMHLANLLFFASLISVFVSNNYFYIPLSGPTNITAQTFSGFLIALSWIGVKSINMIIYPTLAFLSMYRIGEVNKAMGKIGNVYLLCSYFSLILQFFSDGNIEQKCKNFFNEFKNDIFVENETPSNYVNIGNNYYLYDDILPEVERKIERKIFRKKIDAISIYRGKQLNDDDYICSYGINNGAVIVFLLKPNHK